MTNFWESSQCRVQGFLHKWKPTEDIMVEICERCFETHYTLRSPTTGELSRLNDVQSHKREMLQSCSPEYHFEKEHAL